MGGDYGENEIASFFGDKLPEKFRKDHKSTVRSKTRGRLVLCQAGFVVSDNGCGVIGN
jgi:hypothetical protein